MPKTNVALGLAISDALTAVCELHCQLSELTHVAGPADMDGIEADGIEKIVKLANEIKGMVNIARIRAENSRLD